MAITILPGDRAYTPTYKNPNEAELLGRLGSAEEQAQRQKLARDLMIEQQQAQRQLAAQQARSGIRGGAATAQQARLAQQIQQQRAVGEEQGLLQRTMFNIEQAQKERFSKLAQDIAMKQIAASLEGQKAMAAAAERGAQIAAQAGQQPQGKSAKDIALNLIYPGLGFLGL